jgi:hypothetical protein
MFGRMEIEKVGSERVKEKVDLMLVILYEA